MKYPAAVLLAALGLVGSIPAWAGTMYCCTDANGRKTCGDTLPEACYGRAYKEITGGVTRIVDAPLTPEQKVEREAEIKRKKEVERMVLEERRRDQALLNTYGSVADIDYMRDRAINGINNDIRQAQAKLTEATNRKQQLAQKAAAYGKAPVPYEITSQQRTADAEIAAEQKILEIKQKELEEVRAKFDAEKARYLELTRGSRSAPAPAPAPAAPAGGR